MLMKHQEKKERESGIVSEEIAAEEIKQEQSIVESEREDLKEDEKDVKKEDEDTEVKKEEDEKDVKVLTSSVRSMSL
ncbi:hypothetical protein OEA41_008612 [Lepraria neglecta]|uniref:Uncharacterized protein n=1 Tax=Lepraria neglecta TaxID=209136 RepID=A0AAD9Z032_9LECA|nr:hypothetical protein OEA41_008612 [Lepraria neglecta]